MHNALFARACCVVILGPSLRIITKPTKSLLSENKKKILQNPVNPACPVKPVLLFHWGLKKIQSIVRSKKLGAQKKPLTSSLSSPSVRPMNHLYEQEIRYKVLKLLASKANLSQREMAKRMGISLGKTNYVSQNWPTRASSK